MTHTAAMHKFISDSNALALGADALITSSMIYYLDLLNIRHSNNDHGTMEGGFSLSTGRGGKSTALSDFHGTVAFPSTQIAADTQPEVTAIWQVQTKRPTFIANPP
ncbi:hypothetical protein BT96DRAFT_928968 [Gymnopus androsaceus JB14]|uniref:Uncharacterized protein n=1 Tax=Gymnopus androsaceus JB14 TaxID=1447944 RepID=A0A6A4GIA8_9AGAR|nr:hypothetical protein BT96DRAFT_928968 [Gymnopus androsaceus JB14]